MPFLQKKIMAALSFTFGAGHNSRRHYSLTQGLKQAAIHHYEDI